MHRCILPLDIFRYLLTLDNHYLPVCTFLALRAACKQILGIYTKQKYIDKYSVYKTEILDHYDRHYYVQTSTRLPNGKLHGMLCKHIFIPTRVNGILDYHSNPNEKHIRIDIATKYGLNKNKSAEELAKGNYVFYWGSHCQFYYLGQIAGCHDVRDVNYLMVDSKESTENRSKYSPCIVHVMHDVDGILDIEYGYANGYNKITDYTYIIYTIKMDGITITMDEDEFLDGKLIRTNIGRMLAQTVINYDKDTA